MRPLRMLLVVGATIALFAVLVPSVSAASPKAFLVTKTCSDNYTCTIQTSSFKDFPPGTDIIYTDVLSDSSVQEATVAIKNGSTTGVCDFRDPDPGHIRHLRVRVRHGPADPIPPFGRRHRGRQQRLHLEWVVLVRWRRLRRGPQLAGGSHSLVSRSGASGYGFGCIVEGARPGQGPPGSGGGIGRPGKPRCACSGFPLRSR